MPEPLPFTVDTPTSATERMASAGFIGYFRAHRIFNWRFTGLTGIGSKSAVAVSLTEVDGNQFPFSGEATMKVYNVIPDNAQEVFVRGEVDWDEDINIRASFVVG